VGQVRRPGWLASTTRIASSWGGGGGIIRYDISNISYRLGRISCSLYRTHFSVKRAGSCEREKERKCRKQNDGKRESAIENSFV
jgi:hypothetical protein